MARRARPIRAWQLPETAPPPTGQAAALDAALDSALVRQLGAVPVVLPLVEQLDLRGVVNRRCHPTEESAGAVDVGLSTVVLVLNRLLAPQPLVHVETWLAGTVLPDLLDVRAEQCNDDRLARTLDALTPHLGELWQDLLVRAIRVFALDLRYLCYDITSVSFTGAYEEADLITFGYSRDHRPDRQQLEVAATLTGEGGVPVDYRVLAGNVADRTTPQENLARLQGLLALLPARPPDQARPLVISDRAMLTEEALAAYADSALHYLGPLDPSLGDGAVRALLARVSAEELAAAPLAYRPQRAAKDADWEDYHGVRRTLQVPHPQPGQPPLEVQALVVWSPGKARLEAQKRLTYLTRLEQALTDLQRNRGRRPSTTVVAVQKRVATLLRRHPARAFVEVQVTGGTDADAAPLALRWQVNMAALQAAAALDGRYVLGTNDTTLSDNQMLSLAKRRDVPEKRFALLKGPLAVRPVYLHKQDRLLSLVFCALVALLVFALLELLARRALLTVSGTTLLEQFAPLSMLVLLFRDGTALRHLSGLAPPMATVLHALGFPPAERYVT
ncbi:MAG: hypothetical protein NVSMB65_16810 [Chloroflexota bacterium]